MDGRIRETFEVDDTIVTALPKTALDVGSSQDRYVAWRTGVGVASDAPPEYLLPRIVIDIASTWPEHLAPHANAAPDLAARAAALGPWEIPFPLGADVKVMAADMKTAVARHRFVYRVHLINGAVAKLLGDALPHSTVLDIGCHSGLFSLDLATRGAQHVDGVDLRAHNIAQATFVAEQYGLTNTKFEVSDADDIGGGRSWDVVLNLGLLYHVLNPFQLIEQARTLCRSFAIIDTVCHTEPVSAFFVMGDKDVARTSEGKDVFELHPTYRAVIDLMRQAGFSEIFEVVGRGEHEHDLYKSGNRRCFLAVK